MSHSLRLTSERTSIQLGQAKGTETVDIPMISTRPWLIVFAPQAGQNNHLRSHIRHLQFVLGVVLQRLMVPGTFSRALRMLRSRRNVLSPRPLRRTA